MFYIQSKCSECNKFHLFAYIANIMIVLIIAIIINFLHKVCQLLGASFIARAHLLQFKVSKNLRAEALSQIRRELTVILQPPY
jgi:hypothetical protein